ncbi:MAG: Fis family transcriptional regulator [Denitrovibrio sp.]|nr:MAG: Fis family transcriptional regulator [Denitrovibrio sp.]
MELSSEILDIIYHNVCNGIYVTDGKGVTLGVNKPYEIMSGIKSEELVGKSLYQLVHVDKVFSGSASLLVLEKKTPITITYHTKTDKKFLAKGKPIFDENGNIKYVINTIWDLTAISYKDAIDSDTARDSMLDTSDFVSSSPHMIKVIDLCMRIANTESTIFITGESGVGKGLVATIIHQASDRKKAPMIKLNCAAIPEGLIESELFGYVKGAFTGADSKGKAGLFEAAENGVIFLDEISEMPLYTQSKLLSVLQEREYTPVGGTQPKKTNARVIAATNKNIWQMVQEGKFREDLYYRLNVVPIEIPPLRQRPEDIAPLILFFLHKYNKKYGSYKKFSDDVTKRMETAVWQGNVRELENVVERLVVSNKSDLIDIKDYDSLASIEHHLGDNSLKSHLETYEKNLLINAVSSCRSTRELAKLLQTSQPSVVRKLQKYGISLSSNS